MHRAACERRVYRLAALLTGSPIAAAEVIEHVLAAQPDLRRLDDARLDRLTILRCREAVPEAGIIADDSLPRVAAEALAGLRSQPREAWVLHRLYAMTPRDAARAMDCSRDAATRHLAEADARIAEAGPADRLAEALLAWTLELEIPAFHRVRIERRRRRRIVLRIAVVVVVVGLFLLAAWGADHLLRELGRPDTLSAP